MSHTPEPAYRLAAPLFWDAEDGDVTWAEGHPEDWLLRLALAGHLREWDMDDREAATRALTCKVTRVWLRPKGKDPDSEEFEECRRWNRGAYRWTRIEPYVDQPTPWDTPPSAPRERGL